MSDNQAELKGERLKKIRETLGFNQTQFARVVKSEQGAISKMEARDSIKDSVKEILKLRYWVNPDYIDGVKNAPMFTTPYSAFSERFDLVLKLFNIQPLELYALAGLSSGQRNDVEMVVKQGQNINLGDAIDKIVQVLPIINKDWLLNNQQPILMFQSAKQSDNDRVAILNKTNLYLSEVNKELISEIRYYREKLKDNDIRFSIKD